MVPTSWEKTDLRLKLPQNPKGLGIQGSCPDAGEKQTPKEGCIVRFSKDSSDLGQTGFVGRGAGNSHTLGWQSRWALWLETQTAGREVEAEL